MHNGLLSGFVKTQYGKFELTVSNRGLVRIDFPSKSSSHQKVHNMKAKDTQILLRAKSLLKDYFSGSRVKFGKIPIDWSIFRPFDRQVLAQLLRVKPGKTITYGELAKRSHFPRAARAVGNALNRNPIPILIPCHRVLRKDLILGGYRGGNRWKQLLLNIDKQHEIR